MERQARRRPAGRRHPELQLLGSDPRGVNQVGCVYTAQGFEFDYCGVIFGRDLRFDATTAQWVAITRSRGIPGAPVGRRLRRPREEHYRVLLTRG